MEGNMVLYRLHGGVFFPPAQQVRNLAVMINWVVRDESLHLKFSINLIQNALERMKSFLTEEFCKRDPRYGYRRRKLGNSLQ